VFGALPFFWPMVAPLFLDRQLRSLMLAVGIDGWQVLSDRSGIGLKRLRQLRRGNWDGFRVSDLRRLAGVLEISLEELWLLLTMQPQAGDDRERAWQLAAFQQMESFLTYWPAAAHRVEQGGDLPAAKLLPLVKPIDRLLASWGIESIGQVGETLAFDPQQHQSDGSIEPGALVKVRYPGYRQADKLLTRAQVSILAH
jgi:hypothetical protein